MEILQLFLSEEGNINLIFDQNVEETLRTALEIDDLDINALKSNGNLTEENWVKSLNLTNQQYF